MLELMDKPNKYDGRTMKQRLDDAAAAKGEKLTAAEKITEAIEVLKTSPINGCITGSCLMEGFDPDNWGTQPDVDCFVYGEDELVRAVNFASYALQMVPGKGTERSRKQEAWKLDRLYKSGLNHKIGITTYTFECDGVMINFTFKQTKFNGRWVPLITAADVLASFDMSIVMQGIDIQHHVWYDMRVGDPRTAVPNPLRDHDCVMWTVAKWVRQFDRVVKYYNRGYDTRPMAEFYLCMIDECIEAGCLFDSEESQTAFENFSQEFIEKRNTIQEWLDEHKED